MSAAASSAPRPPAAAPLVVAHRANVDGPSPAANSVSAIAAAAAAGADAVELDVRRSVDGHLVLGHDAVQWRRHGRVQVPRAVIRWNPRGWMPFLDALGDALDCALGLGLQVKLDVKDPAAVPAVRRHCRDRRLDPVGLALWCRSAGQIAETANHQVFGEVALLAQRQTAEGYIREAVRANATAVSLDPGLLTEASVSAAHQQGLTVYAWIVGKDRHRAAVELGVDGLVTDWVAPARGGRV